MQTRTNWWIFAASLFLVLMGMGWISYATMGVEKRQIEAEKRALLEENVRLALWRMDTKVAPLIRQEFSQPLWQDRKQASAIPPAYIHLYFHLDENNHFDFLPSQVPAVLTQEFAQKVPIDYLRELPSPKGKNVAPTKLATPVSNYDEPNQTLTIASQSDIQVQQYKNLVELDKRKSIFKKNSINSNSNYWNTENQEQTPFEDSRSSIVQEYLDPKWIQDELILARTVNHGDQQITLEGVWFNWPELRSQLLQEIYDLLPNARLEPMKIHDSIEQDRLLATLPVRLLPGDLPLSSASSFSPMVFSLGIAWLCVLIAAGAIMVLLNGAIALSERRGAFVSAVTHELRTPLTTFRMYTEMLSEGMVPSEEKRQRYLKTLSQEAERLSTLVENVLLYARIENHRNSLKQESITLSDLLTQITPRLRQRSEQAGMELQCELSEEIAQQMVITDPAAIEHILFNLVDNAAKYANDATDKRIHLEFRIAEQQRLHICVRDHGSGIAIHETRAIFEPFVKSTKHQAGTAPGVGLGLALSRRLAKQIGGELELRQQKEGASFCLSLPLKND